MTAPFETFLDNANQVVELFDLHDEKNAGKNNYHKHEILTKSAVVLLVACWEAFLEDTVEVAVEFLVANVECPKALPKGLLKFVATELKENKNELKVWELADGGWRDVLGQHYRTMLSKHLGPFNTPRAGNVDNLFLAVLGMENLSSCWYWKGMSSERAKEVLSDAVTLRGSIAHRVQASKKVTRAVAGRYGAHFVYLAIKTSNRVRRHLHSITGTYPWPEECANSVK